VQSTGTSLGDEGCFASILQNSLTRETTTKTNCTNCSRLTTFTSRRRYGTDMLGNEVRRFPPVLSINASIISDEHLEVWRDTPLARSKHGRKRFLPDGVRIRLGEGGDVQVYDDNDSSPSQPQDMRYIVRVRNRVQDHSGGIFRLKSPLCNCRHSSHRYKSTSPMKRILSRLSEVRRAS
jgi:hypothetical protein